MQGDPARDSGARLPVKRGQVNVGAIVTTVLGALIIAAGGFIYRTLDEARETKRQQAELERKVGRMEDTQERHGEILQLILERLPKKR